MKKSLITLAMTSSLLFSGYVSAGVESTQAPLAQPSHQVMMPVGYAKAIAQQAYIWGWPLVNQANRRAMITQAPTPGHLNGILPVADQGRLGMLNDYIDPGQSFVTCPNQDVVYGLGFFALDEQPVVIQIPDFSDRFWVYALYDQRTDQFGYLGKPYQTKPGFYLVVGPNWKGDIPKGIEAVITSPTELANIIPRVFMDDTNTDREAIQPLVNQVMAYPLNQFTGEMQTYNWDEAPNIPAPVVEGERKWVTPETFFDQFAAVLDSVPPLPGEEAMYANYRALLAAADADPAIKQAIIDTAIETEKTVVSDFFKWKHNGVPAGNGWNRSINNAQWGVDYYNRLGTSKSNMFDNRPSETQYFYSDGDSKGVQLSGEHNYQITFPKGELPPVNGFWSMTLYDQHHMFYQNDQNRFSLGTKNKGLKFNEDGSLTLYAGHHSPGKKLESNWLPSPQGDFSLYIRTYWGKAEILDGTWLPPVIESK